MTDSTSSTSKPPPAIEPKRPETDFRKMTDQEYRARERAFLIAVEDDIPLNKRLPRLRFP
jgi:hypothetical protein